ncbi:HigA family addiction module antidote protein [Candidatus Microgenomates bacterium]|nr:HigA family addiction module antidote protein [Candidatus Microgenomates bacterium]
MNKKTIKPIYPGEVLEKEFLKPYKISQYRLAKDISVSPRRINEIIHGIRAISVDTALRFAKYFNTSPQFWLNLQTKYDIEVCQAEKVEEIKKEVGIFNFAY